MEFQHLPEELLLDFTLFIRINVLEQSFENSFGLIGSLFVADLGLNGLG